MTINRWWCAVCTVKVMESSCLTFSETFKKYGLYFGVMEQPHLPVCMESVISCIQRICNVG